MIVRKGYKIRTSLLETSWSSVAKEPGSSHENVPLANRIKITHVSRPKVEKPNFRYKSLVNGPYRDIAL